MGLGETRRLLEGVWGHWDVLGGTGRGFRGTGTHWAELGGTGRVFRGTGIYWEGAWGHWNDLGGDWEGLCGHWVGSGVPSWSIVVRTGLYWFTLFPCRAAPSGACGRCSLTGAAR